MMIIMIIVRHMFSSFTINFISVLIFIIIIIIIIIIVINFLLKLIYHICFFSVCMLLSFNKEIKLIIHLDIFWIPPKKVLSCCASYNASSAPSWALKALKAARCDATQAFFEASCDFSTKFSLDRPNAWQTYKAKQSPIECQEVT